jgi:hypothetical protein
VRFGSARASRLGARPGLQLEYVLGGIGSSSRGVLEEIEESEVVASGVKKDCWGLIVHC